MTIISRCVFLTYGILFLHRCLVRSWRSPGRPVIALADRIPAQANQSDLPEQPDYPCILAVFNQATGPLRARDVCEASVSPSTAPSETGRRPGSGS